MELEKFRISIIDFMCENGKHEVGRDRDNEPVCLGDLVEYNGEKNWFVGYRYGKPMIKQVGMMVSIMPKDFSGVSKIKNTIGAGSDWLIIGYTNEPLYEQVKHVIEKQEKES